MPEMWMPGAVHDPQPGGVTLNKDLPPRATWHITWDALKTDGSQPAFSAVSGYLKRQGYCPHLMWDPFTGYIEQYYSADVGGRALNAWNEDGQVHVQIETFFTPGCVRDGVTYATVADTPLIGWSEILTWLDTLGIPRVWPMGATQWQGNSRDATIWNASAGHYGHSNVPNNTHTDPGPMPGLTIQEDDMAISDEQTTFIIEALKSLVNNVATKTTIKEQTEAIPLEVWSYKNPGVGGADAYQIIRDAVAGTDRLVAEVAALAAKAAVGGATVAQIEQAVKAGLSAGVKVDATVTVAGTK